MEKGRDFGSGLCWILNRNFWWNLFKLLLWRFLLPQKILNFKSTRNPNWFPHQSQPPTLHDSIEFSIQSDFSIHRHSLPFRLFNHKNHKSSHFCVRLKKNQNHPKRYSNYPFFSVMFLDTLYKTPLFHTLKFALFVLIQLWQFFVVVGDALKHVL